MQPSPYSLRSRKIPFLHILLISIIILVFLSISLTAYVSFRNGQKAVLDVSLRLRNETASRIQSYMLEFLETPHQITAINANAVSEGLLSSTDYARLTRHFFNQLDIFDTVTSIYFGSPQGGLVNSGREGATKDKYSITTETLAKGPLTKYALDDLGRQTKVLFRIPEFDSTKRPWYQGAAARGAAVWSQVYVLSTGQDMAIAASRPVYNDKRDLLGVMSVDIFLSHLSFFLKNLKIGESGSAFIMEPSGLLIATSTADPLFMKDPSAKTPSRLNAGESNNPVIRRSIEAIRNFQAHKGFAADGILLDFDISGQRQYLQMTTIQDGYGLNWQIVVVVPESDFLAKIKQGNKATLLLIAIASALALFIGYLLARKVTRPIMELNAAAQSLARGETAKAILKDTRIKELNGLIKSFNRMAGNLQDSLSALRMENAERKQAQESLKASESFFRNLVDNLPFPVLASNTDHQTEYVNPKFKEVFGYDAKDLPDIKIRREKFFPDPAYRASISREIEEWLASDKFSFSSNRRYTDIWGKTHEVAVTVMRFEDKIYDILEDVTGLRNAEEQLRQAQRMEALGTLAGGIAHDFNNILAVIMGYSELSLEDARSGRNNEKSLEQILKAALRARDLVNQILAFSGKISPTLRPLNLNHIIAQTEKMLERIMPRMVHIESRLANDLSLVNADPLQMTQLLMNLCGNANDAMPEGGTLVIKTEHTHLGNEYNLLEEVVAPGDYVQLSVSDTGHGISPEIIKKIFDPFFTDKEIGKGTGLGLATVYGIVKNHGGHIVCDSEVGRGTTFKVYLPVAGSARAQEPESQNQEPDIVGGNETILLVDDEENLRTLGREVLSDFGYSVLLSSTGEEAIEIYLKKGAEIDLIILDISMPGMGGHKCLEQLLAINPACKVIIASGYAKNGHLKDTLELGAADYMTKPFKMTELAQTVRRVLDGPEPPPQS